MANLLVFLIVLLAMVACLADRVDDQKAYMAEVASREGVIELKSGMLVEILHTTDKQDAKSPTKGDSCECTYLGTFMDGSRFDGGTTSFAPNQVIKGWTEAMQYMAEGDKWRLHIPYDLAYGERGRPPKIPAQTPLVFEIEIHKVKRGGKSVDEARAMFAAGQVNPKPEL